MNDNFIIHYQDGRIEGPVKSDMLERLLKAGRVSLKDGVTPPGGTPVPLGSLAQFRMVAKRRNPFMNSARKAQPSRHTKTQPPQRTREVPPRSPDTTHRSSRSKWPSPLHVRSAPKVSGVRVAPRLNTTRPASKMSGSRPAPKTSGSRPAPKTSGVRPAPKMSGVRPAPKLSGVRPAPKMSGVRLAPKMSGVRPAPKLSGVRPAPKMSGVRPAPKMSGVRPAPKMSGVRPAPKMSGVRPAPKLSGVRPAPKLSGVRPAPKLSGTYIPQGNNIEPVFNEAQKARERAKKANQSGKRSKPVSKKAREKQKRMELFKRASQHEEGDPFEGALAFGVGQPDRGVRHVLGMYAIVFAISFVLVSIGLGEREFQLLSDDAMLYIRNGMLLVAGIVGLVALRKEPLARIGLAPRFLPMLAALPIACVIGLMAMPIARLDVTADANIGVVAGLLLMRAAGECVFFHGFITRTLLIEMKEPLSALFISALLYGLYALTFSVILGGSPINIIFGVVVYGFGAGMPLAVMYWKTRSVFIPVIAHFIILIMVAVAGMQYSAQFGAG